MDEAEFRTRRLYFEPLKSHVNILMQNQNGPCMLLAICNIMVLKGQLRIDRGRYHADDIVALVTSASSSNEDLSYLVRGCDVVPCFSGCSEFRGYPQFLTGLGIRMFHAMVPDPESPLFETVSQHDYESLTLRLTEENLDPDERMHLEQWWEMIQPQVTSIGLSVIDSAMANGDLVIFFRANHFSVLYKTMNRVFSLVTDRGFLDTNCFWETVPDELGASKYFDDRFILSELQSRNTPRVIVQAQPPPRSPRLQQPPRNTPHGQQPAPCSPGLQQPLRNAPRGQEPPRNTPNVPGQQRVQHQPRTVQVPVNQSARQRYDRPRQAPRGGSVGNPDCCVVS